MAKKKRHFTKGFKQKETTVQEAWDIVAEYLANHMKTNMNPSVFIDSTGTYTNHEHGKIYAHTANGTTLLESTENFTNGKGWWG